MEIIGTGILLWIGFLVAPMIIMGALSILAGIASMFIKD